MLAATRDRAVWLTAVGTLVLRYLGATDDTLLHFHRGGGASAQRCVCVFFRLPAGGTPVLCMDGPSSVPGKYAYRYAGSERVVKLIKTCGINKSRSFSTLLNNHGTIGENANRREQPVTSTAPLTES